MKLYNIKILLLVILPINLSAQWFWQNLKQARNQLHSVCLLDENRVLIFGLGGTMTVLALNNNFL
jgi:hypothetical protein